jgi:hypothetical protein
MRRELYQQKTKTAAAAAKGTSVNLSLVAILWGRGFTNTKHPEYSVKYDG